MITNFIRIFSENPNLILILILILMSARFTQSWLERKKSFRFRSSAGCVLTYIESTSLLLTLFPFQYYIEASPKLLIYTTILATYVFIVLSIIFILGFIYYLIREIKATFNNNEV